MDVNTILSSIVVSAAVAGYVSLRSHREKIAIENVTQERTKWRDKIRKRAVLIHEAIIDNRERPLNKLRAEFALLLNPYDDCDNEILDIISLSSSPNTQARKFIDRVSRLLKHDWERAKLEATSTLGQPPDYVKRNIERLKEKYRAPCCPYRRRKWRCADTWHFCTDCSDWPTYNYETKWSKPTSGGLCEECKDKRKDGNCT